MNGTQTNMNKELIGKAKRALGGVKNSKKFDFKTKVGLNEYLNYIGIGTNSKKREPGKLYVACEKVRNKNGQTSQDRKDTGVKGRMYIETYDKDLNVIRLAYADSYEDLMIGISILAHIFKDHTPLNDMIENETTTRAREIIRGAGQSTANLKE